MTEGVVVLALLLRRFRFELVADQSVAAAPMVILRPKNGIGALIFDRPQLNFKASPH